MKSCPENKGKKGKKNAILAQLASTLPLAPHKEPRSTMGTNLVPSD